MFIKIQLHQISPLILLYFLEFLTENNASHSNIANHISAIKACCTIYNLPLSPFQDPRIKYYLKAIALYKPFKVKLKKIVDLHTLQLITRSCDFTYMGQIYKALYLVAFFSFLQISNLLPHSIEAFSPIHQLSQGDVIFAPPGVHIIIKWTKTLQTRDKVKILKLPSLGSNPLCPVLALKNALSLVPKGKNLPVFQVKTNLKWVALTDTKARRHFSKLLQKIGLRDSAITLHSLSRSGATFAFNANVPLQKIQSHGTWTSECVWKYITQDHQASSQVAAAFHKSLYIPTSS